MLLAWLIHGYLFFAGGSNFYLQFCIYSFQIYWSQIFVLPNKVVRSILEQKFNCFLWNGTCSSDICSEKTKVSWDLMCLEEGRWVGVKKARGLIRIRLLSIRTLGIQMDQMVFFMMSMHGYRQDGGMGGWYKSWTPSILWKKEKRKKRGKYNLHS